MKFAILCNKIKGKNLIMLKKKQTTTTTEFRLSEVLSVMMATCTPHEALPVPQPSQASAERQGQALRAGAGSMVRAAQWYTVQRGP